MSYFHIYNSKHPANLTMKINPKYIQENAPQTEKDLPSQPHRWQLAQFSVF